MAAPPLRWGVLGTGWIAQRFVGSVQRHTQQQVTAVASRDGDRAAMFAQQHEIGAHHGSYHELVDDPRVDVVYIATPHNTHLPLARLALEGGKHVVVEKPLALDAAEASQMAALATARGLFCMEAMWTLFLPKFDVVRQLLDDGVLGEIRTVMAEYGEYFTPDHRMMRPELAGGPLLDLGIYPVSFAVWVMGAPENVLAAGQPHGAGVNGQASAILRDARGNQAIIHTTLFSTTPAAATIAGTAGTLVLPGTFCQPGDLVLSSADGSRRLTFTEPPVAHDALYFEAAEVARCISDGQVESWLRPLADSVKTLQVIDEVRRQCGITFSPELSQHPETSQPGRIAGPAWLS
jgi:predicted dehydrogenase